jgi:hypothetical protein
MAALGTEKLPNVLNAIEERAFPERLSGFAAYGVQVTALYNDP